MRHDAIECDAVEADDAEVLRHPQPQVFGGPDHTGGQQVALRHDRRRPTIRVGQQFMAGHHALVHEAAGRHHSGGLGKHRAHPAKPIEGHLDGAGPLGLGRQRPAESHPVDHVQGKRDDRDVPMPEIGQMTGSDLARKVVVQRDRQHAIEGRPTKSDRWDRPPPLDLDRTGDPAAAAEQDHAVHRGRLHRDGALPHVGQQQQPATVGSGLLRDAVEDGDGDRVPEGRQDALLHDDADDPGPALPQRPTAWVRPCVVQFLGRCQHPVPGDPDTGPEPLNANDAVETETPASAATSARVGRLAARSDDVGPAIASG